MPTIKWLLNVAFFTSALVAMQSPLHATETGAPSIFVVTSTTNDTFKKYLKFLDQHLEYRLILTNETKNISRECVSKQCIYITAGPRALMETLATADNSPIVATFISSIAFQQIQEQRAAHTKLTAIYAEPALSHQLKIIKSLYPKYCKIGVLHSDKSMNSINELTSLASNSGIKLLTHKVNNNQPINKSLDAVKEADVLLAIPDNHVYNAETFRQIILTTYRRGQPIIGFSQNFVEAGALGTSYTSAENMAAETTLTVSAYLSLAQLPEPYHANHYGVVFNDDVANSLNIGIREKDFGTDDIQFVGGVTYVNNNVK